MEELNSAQKMEYIAAHLSPNTLFLQLAEEASELAQAAIRFARTCSPENPAPIAEQEALARVQEELADVLLYVRALAAYLPVDGDIESEKKVESTAGIGVLRKECLRRKTTPDPPENVQMERIKHDLRF